MAEENEVTIDDIESIAVRMSQELQDVIDDAKEAGCENPFPHIQALIEEWEDIYKKLNSVWQRQILNDPETELSIELKP